MFDIVSASHRWSNGSLMFDDQLEKNRKYARTYSTFSRFHIRASGTLIEILISSCVTKAVPVAIMLVDTADSTTSSVLELGNCLGIAIWPMGPSSSVYPLSVRNSVVSMNSNIITSGYAPLEINRGLSNLNCRVIELISNSVISTTKEYRLISAYTSSSPRIMLNLMYLDKLRRLYSSSPSRRRRRLCDSLRESSCVSISTPLISGFM